MEVLLTFDDKGRRQTGVGTSPVGFDLSQCVGSYVWIWSDEDLYLLPSGETSAPTFDTSTDRANSDIPNMPKRYKANSDDQFVYVQSERPQLWVRTQGATNALVEVKQASPRVS